MKRVTLVCFGKLKTPGFAEAVGEFTKRLGAYADFQVFEMKPLPIPEKSETLANAIPEKEAAMVEELMESPAFSKRHSKSFELWCLDETGKPMKTTEWADTLRNLQERGTGELVLVIGGSLGLGEALLKRAHRRVSFGPQTVSHELARLLLVEQLYRALSYLKGHPYHNEG